MGEFFLKFLLLIPLEVDVEGQIRRAVIIRHAIRTWITLCLKFHDVEDDDDDEMHDEAPTGNFLSRHE